MIIITVVAVVDDDINYRVYMSSELIHSSLLQSATVYFITKCDSLFITKFDKCYYNVRHV